MRRKLLANPAEISARFAVTVVLLLCAARAWAAVPYAVGDVFAAIGNGQVKHFSPTGTLLETLDDTTGSTYTAGMCFDGFGNLFVTNFSTGTVSKFDNAGNLVSANFFTGLANPESCVRDVAGNFYVGQAGAGTITKFDATGAQIATFTVATDARGTDWIDLAADQCTMYYTSEGSLVKRFDVCTNTQLTDFATALGPQYALRTLQGGGALVAASSEVHQLDSSGATVAQYTASGEGVFFALNRDPDGVHFWSGGLSSGNIYRYDISPPGPPNVTFNANYLTALGGLAVFGELTQGQPTPTPGGGPPGAVVPTLSGYMLALFAFILAVCAVIAIYRR